MGGIGLTLVICVDDRGGMSFGGRRQSQDRVLRARVAALAKGHRLLMNAYSAKQFSDVEGILCEEDFLRRAEAGDVCFQELGEVSLDGVRRLILYRWNRHYPSDKKFLAEPEQCGFRKVGSAEFAGSSHEKITEDIYERV